jgi:RNA polymerase sigma factor (sigma-70 family)
MATSDAILSIFDAKPKNAMEMIKNDGSGKNRSKRMKAEEDIMYERKFARAAELNVNELRKRLDAGKRARQILVSKNIGLARLCAHRTMKQINTEANTNFSYQLSDMISDGQEGLVKAASKYDPSLGFRFSTYAYAWVLSSIQRGLDSNSNTIRTPTHARVEKMKIKNLEKNLDESLGRMPTDEEVARIAGVDVKRIEAIGNFGVSYAMPRATGSGNFSGDIGDASEILVADQGDANGATAMADFCTTDAEERALKLVERDLFKDDLEHVFDTLLPRERFVLRHKFGLDEFEDERSGRGNPMANILARKMGLSVNAVRSIEQRALEKLRAPQRARILEKHAILPEANFTFSSNPLRVDDRPITGGVHATNAKKKSVEEEISDIILERVEVTLKSEDVEKIAQSSVRNTTWSSYELKLMSDMRGKGIPWKKVAVAIGRTETSCKQMYRKVGGSTRKHTPSMDEKTKAAMQKIEEGDAIINA